MSRLGPIPLEQMTPAQRALFDDLTGGKRSTLSKQTSDFFNDQGALRGPFNAMLRSPELGNLVQRVGEAVRFATTLTGPQREIGIITAGAFWRSNYEFVSHRKHAIREGASEEDCEAVRQGRAPSTPDLATVWKFVKELNETTKVSDETYNEAYQLLGEQGVAELVMLSGYYALVSQLLNAFQVQLPAGVAPPFPD